MKSANTHEISEWLTLKLSEILNIPRDQIDPNKKFSNYGLTSIAAVGLVGDLEKWLGRPLNPELTYDYPTINSLSQYLAD